MTAGNVLFGSSYRVRFVCIVGNERMRQLEIFLFGSSVRMYCWQCQFARTVTGPFCSVRHTEFSSYVSLAMSVRQNINWAVSFSSPYRTLVTRHKEGAVAKRKRRYTYIFFVLQVCDCGNAT